MDLRRLRVEEWLAGLLGVVLLVSLFLDWYDYGDAAGGRSGWESFAILDILLAALAAMAIALAAVAALHRTQAVPTALASLTTLVGLVATALVVAQAASPPVLHFAAQTGPRKTGYIAVLDATREAGLWIALASCIGITAAALWAMRDERFPEAVVEANRVEIPTMPAPPPEGAGEAGS